MADEQDEAPCALERWLEQAAKQNFDYERKISDDDLAMFIRVNKSEMEKTITDMLVKHTIGYSAAIELFNVLRGAHIALSFQLGLVEQWMRVILTSTEQEVPQELIDEEREAQMELGEQHVDEHAESVTEGQEN